MIENGFVHIPETAPWLAEYLHELTVFPEGQARRPGRFDRAVPRLVQEAFPGPGHLRVLPPACGSCRAAAQTATHQNRICPRLHGMARRAEESAVNRGVRPRASYPAGCRVTRHANRLAMDDRGRDAGYPAPPAQVGSRTGAPVWPRYPDRATFPAPSTSHAACGFPALRAPICFMPRLMGPILPGRLSARRVAPDSC